MYGSNNFRATNDGRYWNTVLGKGFLDTPSDSIVMIAVNTQVTILCVKSGPKGLSLWDGLCQQGGYWNTVLSKGFLATSSDSMVMIAVNTQVTILYIKSGLKGLRWFMPTSGISRQYSSRSCSKETKLFFLEIHSALNCFGSLMDIGKLSICGEESFGTWSYLGERWILGC